MSDKCPKCGAELTSATDTLEYWECGSTRQKQGTELVLFRGFKCLHNHVAALEAIVDKATCYSYAIIPAGDPLPDGSGPSNADYALVISLRRTRYGERKWAILLIPDGSSPEPGDRILGIDGAWGEEPQPSSRRAKFLAQFRFDSLDAAWQAAEETTRG